MKVHLLWIFFLTQALGCASTARNKPLVAVFPIEAEHFRLSSKEVSKLQHHAAQLLQDAGGVKVLPQKKVSRTIRRRKRRSEKNCSSMKCQKRIAQGLLGANRSLKIRVAKNLLAQCDVFTMLNNLDDEQPEYGSRSRSGCSFSEVKASLDKSLCILITQIEDKQKLGREDAPAIAPAGEEQNNKECLVGANFLWLEENLADLRRIKIVGNRKMRLAHERELAEKSLALKREYERVLDLGYPRWRVAALFRIATVYEIMAQAYADTYEKVKTPWAIKRQGSEAVLEYEKQIGQVRDQKVAPVKAAAQKFYEKCLKQARQHGIDSTYAQFAKQRLHELDPQKYPAPPTDAAEKTSLAEGAGS